MGRFDWKMNDLKVLSTTVSSHGYSIHPTLAVYHNMIMVIISIMSTHIYTHIQRGNSALHLACKLGLVEIVKTLCGHDADASLQNKKVII